MEAWTVSLTKRESFDKEPVQEPFTSGKQEPEPVLASDLNQRDSQRSSDETVDRRRALWISSSVPLRPGGKIGALSSERIWRNFSLAPPLVVILLGIFGLGGSEQARQRIIEQLGYYIDPSGVKVFQDIANHAAEPKTGFWAAPGDTSDAKVQHSRYTVEAHPSGSNPGGVFNEFANLCAITSSAFSKGR